MEQCFYIVLVAPRIPPNAGNVARLCAATGAHLHLVRPLGFRLDDRQLRRAGLDYWEHVELTVHENWETFLSERTANERLFFFSKKGRTVVRDWSRQRSMGQRSNR